jgi:NAD(P)-dependent dehydrogenase (short-subunit alcohol dehydrogenase family)
VNAPLHNRVVLVTGASRGLGQVVASTLLSHGAHLLLAARDPQPLAELVRRLGADRALPGQHIVGVVADVSRPAQVKRLFARVERTFQRLDVLVCNAGVYGPMGLIEEVDWDEWVQAIEINLLGTVLCCRAALPLMRRQKSGKIITLSGGGATQPLPRISAYAASKAAVVRFTETLAEEVRDAGVDVNAVAPGALNTRLLDLVLEAGPERVGDSFFQRARRQKAEGGTPLDRGADLIAFLASSDSDGITGRLLSAVWDDWQGLPAKREQLATSDVYTLRRIVPADRGWAGA